jgi:hypothetical protein
MPPIDKLTLGVSYDTSQLRTAEEAFKALAAAANEAERAIRSLGAAAIELAEVEIAEDAE